MRAAPTLMDRWKAPYAQDTDKRTLGRGDRRRRRVPRPVGRRRAEARDGGRAWRRHPLIMALANPTPEIMPELARQARPDAMICTGRSDYPNQVNNVLCFPYIFRGALDVGATTINEAMKLAAVRAIAELAREAPSDVVGARLWRRGAPFGPDSLIPSPFDPRLILRIAPAVARAAMDSGVATRPIAGLQRLHRVARPLRVPLRLHHEAGVHAPQRRCRKRVIYAEGEDERVLRAVAGGDRGRAWRGRS